MEINTKLYSVNILRAMHEYESLQIPSQHQKHCFTAKLL